MRDSGDNFELAVARGFRPESLGKLGGCEEGWESFGGGETALRVSELPEGAVKGLMTRMRIGLVAPVVVAGRCEAMLLAGERSSGRSFADEDCEFAATLARQAVGALETIRLHEVSIEKERQDREMQIAREIQQSLFPKALPLYRGFEIAARSEPCYEVGGDHYDFIPLSPRRFFAAVADVSGKGTPASLLMASVHASLRARAGGEAPLDQLMSELNRFSAPARRPTSTSPSSTPSWTPTPRRLRYVNAGHVPPVVLGADGGTTGSPRAARRWACSKRRPTTWADTSCGAATR